MENTESVQLSSDRVYRSLPSCVTLCCTSLLTSLPPTSQNYSLDSLLLLFPFPVLGLVRIACSDQFVQFYNRTQPGRLADAQRPCFLGLQKKLKEGIVGKKKVSALHQPKKVNECKISMRTHMCCAYITSAVGTYTCKLVISICTPPMMFPHTCGPAIETIKNEDLVNWVSKAILMALHCLDFVACPNFLTRVDAFSFFLND